MREKSRFCLDITAPKTCSLEFFGVQKGVENNRSVLKTSKFKKVDPGSISGQKSTAP